MPQTQRTRMIFLGESPLADGFRLIGFEARADPTPEQVEKLVRELINKRENVFIVIDQGLAEAKIPAIDRVRNEGGHILVSVVPPLNDPDNYRTLIDDRLRAMFAATDTVSQA
jgi:vacuolar-type H+-ATPase subunit F/Vma7